MSIFREGALHFDFSVADSAMKFDEHHTMSHCMSAVDFVIQWQNTTLLIEIKDINMPTISRKQQNKFITKVKDGPLRREIVKKYSDTMLYKLAEQSITHQENTKYLVLLEASNIQIPSALRLGFNTDMKQNLPLHKSTNWKHRLLNDFQLHSVTSWNERFPQFPVTRLNHPPQVQHSPKNQKG